MDLRKLCLGLWAIAALLLGCEQCTAQVFLVKTEVRSCTLVDCRVEVGTASSVCVGRIGDRWIFLTAGHVFYSNRPEVTSSKLLNTSVAIDRKWIPAVVEGFDMPGAKTDLGLLSVAVAGSLRSLPIAAHAPPSGTEVKIGGFPSGSPYAEVTGKIVPRNTREGPTDFVVSTAVVRGVSGGPVICGGAVVGIVSASDFGSGTWCVGPEKIRQKLVKHLGQMPDCGRPAEVPIQPEGKTVPPQTGLEHEPNSPPPDARDQTAKLPGDVGSSLWTLLWPGLAGVLGLSGPLGVAIYMAGRLIASRIGPKVAQRVEERLHPDRKSPPAQISTPSEFIPPVAAVPVPVAIPATQNRYVDVPVINNEAEALKEAMRLEAEFTRTDHPHVAQHLRRVQDMAGMILKGQQIEKPGWKL